MTKQDKILKRFLSKPNDFSYSELKKFLCKLGYIELTMGKSSGSRIAFFNNETKHLIRLHKPHPKNILKRYQLDYIEDELKSMEVI